MTSQRLPLEGEPNNNPAVFQGMGKLFHEYPLPALKEHPPFKGEDIIGDQSSSQP